MRTLLTKCRFFSQNLSTKQKSYFSRIPPPTNNKNMTIPITKSQTIDAGIALHSPSTDLIKLVNIHDSVNKNDHPSTAVWTDFTVITQYLQEHLFDIIYEIHHTYDKLLIDDGQVQINCPPSTSLTMDTTIGNNVEVDDDGVSNGVASTAGTSNGSSTLLLRTLSEKECSDGGGIIAKREIKVYGCGLTTSSSSFIDDNSTAQHVVYHHNIVIREDVIRASNNVNDLHPILSEQSITVMIPQQIGH